MPGKHPGNTQETPGKHPGNTQETPGIKGAGLEKKTSLAILLGILNKEKEKNNAPGKHPGNNQGKVFLVSCDSSSKFKNGPVLPHWTIDLHSCHQIPTAFELLIENFFPLIENISKCTFPRCFLGVPRSIIFLFFLVQNLHKYC